MFSFFEVELNHLDGEITDKVRLANAPHLSLVGYIFEPNVTEALKRNEQRPERERIPKPGIFATLKRLQRSTLAEGFDQLFSVTSTSEGFQIAP